MAKSESRKYVDFTSRSYLAADVGVIVFVTVVGLGLLSFVKASNVPYTSETLVRTDLWALPGYALLSLTRSFLALTLSFAFALIYGTLAARTPRNEQVMIPILDVLQALPVLTFLPGFVLALTALFPSSRWGLEISCVLMIFTGQVWNLVYAYYYSQKNIVPELREFSQIAHLSGAQKFMILDLPNGLRPLIYNGMMSMSGGWFFLTLCESFTLGNKNFQLPGLGSFLMKTFESGLHFNFLCGLLVMIFLILGSDFLIWKPLVAWVSQYSDHGNCTETAPRSFVLNLLRTTRLPAYLMAIFELFSTEVRLKSQKIQKLKLSPFDSQSKTTVGVFQRHFLRSSKKKKPIAWATWGQWALSFSVGAVVFWSLPKLPEIGKAMGTVDGQTWLGLTNSLGHSFIRVFAVLFISTLWTVPVGLWIGRKRNFAKFMEPFVQNLAAFPAPVLFPLFTQFSLAYGAHSELIAILLMTIGNQWYILFNVLAGTFAIKPELVEVAKLYNFTPWQRFKHVYWPALFPSLITGWITAAGGAWNASCVSEIVQYPGGVMSTIGIGSEISQATVSGNFPKLIAAVIVFTLAIVILNRSVWRSLNEYAAKFQ
jgi:NitT/TauT family transport system permease protein